MNTALFAAASAVALNAAQGEGGRRGREGRRCGMKWDGAIKWGIFYLYLLCAIMCTMYPDAACFAGFMGWLVAALNWLCSKDVAKEGGAE